MNVFCMGEGNEFEDWGIRGRILWTQLCHPKIHILKFSLILIVLGARKLLRIYIRS